MKLGFKLEAGKWLKDAKGGYLGDEQKHGFYLIPNISSEAKTDFKQQNSIFRLSASNV